MVNIELLQKLTDQQSEICLGIGDLKSYADIADELHIAESTVKQYAKEIAAKFDGNLTDQQRKAGPYKLILYWMARGDGEILNAHQTRDSLLLRVVQAKAQAKRALALAATLPP